MGRVVSQWSGMRRALPFWRTRTAACQKKATLPSRVSFGWIGGDEACRACATSSGDSEGVIAGYWHHPSCRRGERTIVYSLCLRFSSLGYVQMILSHIGMERQASQRQFGDPCFYFSGTQRNRQHFSPRPICQQRSTQNPSMVTRCAWDKACI